MQKSLLSLILLSLIVFPSVFAWDGRMALDADKRNIDLGETINYRGFLYWEYPIEGEIVYVTIKEQKTGKILLETNVSPDTNSVDYFNNTAWPFSFKVDTSDMVFKDARTIVVEAKYDDKTTKLDFLIKNANIKEIPAEKETVESEEKIESSTLQPIPKTEEKVDTVQEEMKQGSEEISQGGGCLIATASYGTELASEVQLLREVRDRIVMSTETGSAFMAGFNQLYYLFSPTIADWERQNPIFKEFVKITLTPMISSLSIMSLAQEGSDSQVLGVGISVIFLNIGLYLTAPMVFGLWIKRKLESKN